MQRNITVLYEARNLVIKKSCKFIAFLDVDDFSQKNKFESQIHFKEKKGIIYSNFYKFYNGKKN